VRAFRNVLLVIVSYLVIVTFVEYKNAYPLYTFRYRMTLEVIVDGQVRSGSSVFEVKIKRQPTAFTAPPVTTTWSGEAVFVDLGEGRNVVAVLYHHESPTFWDYPVYVVPKLAKLAINKDEDLKKYARLRGPWEMPASELPVFLSFSDVGNNRTVSFVKADEFGKAFGPAVQFKRVVVEMTDSPVTTQISDQLPFLSDLNAYSEEVRGPESPREKRVLRRRIFMQREAW
jgi:hypothetical protein